MRNVFPGWARMWRARQRGRMSEEMAMHVLMISWEYPPYVVGGMGKHVAELVPAMADLAEEEPDFRLDLLTTRLADGPATESLSHRVRVHRVDVPPMDPQDMFNSVMEANHVLERKAVELAQEDPFDLVHVHDWLVARAGIHLKHRWKAPLVATVHATERGRHQSHLPTELSRRINQLEWELCYEAWRIIVCSGYMAGELQGYFSVPSDKMSIIPNAVNPAPLQACPPEEVERLRRRYAPHGERLLFFVGRITPEKGLQVLLRAMPLILARDPHVRLLVAGKNSEQMQGLVDELGIGHAVELLGFISDEERNCLYNAVDAAIFPSIYEPFGIVALEAMAAGCNVIASSVGGLSEVVRHMNTGITVLANSPESIAWAVEQLFQDPDRARRLREEALNHVHNCYAWPLIARATLELYRTVLEERRRVVW